jgi:tRNA(Leu) C34 or U34 (ribose-2'-O)-methylase TrmL
MFHVILWQPEIPPNTGNIIRLCANTGATLSLVRPLGFELDEPRLRRAGLDYHEFAALRDYPDLESCLEALGRPRTWAFSARASRRSDGAGVGVGEAGDPRVLFAKPDAAREQHDGRRETQPAKIQRQRIRLRRCRHACSRQLICST